jgi:cytochrome c biogenesis protein CcmG, thiol:disulfide interchange protein DsbE
MKNTQKIALWAFVLLFFVAVKPASAQLQSLEIPSVTLKDINGKAVNIQDLIQEGKPIIISFWATWCKPCMNELTAINEEYEDWQAETGVILLAISIDDARSRTRIPTIAKGKGWEFEVYNDENGELKRALGVQNVPHTFILNKEGKIIWQHTSYNPGDEASYYEVLKKIAADETVEPNTSQETEESN